MVLHKDAPRLLLEKMAWLNSVIQKNRIKNQGNSEALREYEELLKVMRYAYEYMIETQRLFPKNERLTMVVEFLTEENALMERELAKYNILRELTNEGTLEAELEKVKHYEEKLMKINDNKNIL